MIEISVYHSRICKFSESLAINVIQMLYSRPLAEFSLQYTIYLLCRYKNLTERAQELVFDSRLFIENRTASYASMPLQLK